MATAYVYQNDRLGDNGDDWAAALIAEHSGSERECEAWFVATYDVNDYTMSYSAP